VRPHRREIEVFSNFGSWHRVDDEADTTIREHLLGLPSEYRPGNEETGEEAKRFDVMAYGLQLAALEGGKEFA
ncbi:hypothetical protein G3M55_21290, partial [Streptomyces sp. SID8455]|nr:hypothetical protein [Streptomyces sp. SID8455]